MGSRNLKPTGWEIDMNHNFEKFLWRIVGYFAALVGFSFLAAIVIAVSGDGQ